LAEPFLAINYQVTTQENLLREPYKFPTLIEIVIRAVMGMCHAVFEWTVRVPDDNVGVGARE